MKKLFEDGILFIFKKGMSFMLGTICIVLAPFLSPAPIGIITFTLGVIVLYLTLKDAYYE